MTELLLALLVFLASHSIPARPRVRQRLVDRFGHANYLIGYGLLSIVLLVWLISAAVRAPIIPLWSSGLWSWHVALAVMLPACWLLTGGLTTANPFSVTLNTAQFDPARPGLVGLVRHPVLWGFAAWAGVHLIANGHLAALILFGVFLLFSLGGMALLDRRKHRQLGPGYARLLPTGRRWTARQLLATFGGGTALYALLLAMHPVLIGPNPGALLFP
ncbi:NnrU family protein [Sphingomonas sp. BN140010]|uniref:NnrU family protein n=1 Tax=Sphingomonas arvum TaxID=2992113 RepID=A0ABT3JFS5_9SPHN|nr:NnrU family protein [Sphingomonas sp. BN140010]MCW3797915.1 NnrU family protein [Sphingomonas sp. BN140010]